MCDLLNFEDFPFCQACFAEPDPERQLIAIPQSLTPQSTKFQNEVLYHNEFPQRSPTDTEHRHHHDHNCRHFHAANHIISESTTAVDPKWDTLFDRNYFIDSELNDVEQYMASTMAQRIMFLDGGMGTTIQKLKFSEDDFRGDRFKEVIPSKNLFIESFH